MKFSRVWHITTVLLLTVVRAELVYAAPQPAGELANASVISEDTSRVCSEYTRNSKSTTYISRIDGEKIAGKRFWNTAKIKIKMIELSATIKALSQSTDSASRKSLKRAKTDRTNLVSARRQLKDCTVRFKNQEASPYVEFEHVQPLLQSQCMTCHGVLGWEGTEESFLANGYVVGGNLEVSPLYTFLAANPEGFTPASMPKGLPALSAHQIWLIRQWIMDIPLSGGPTPTPTGTPGPVDEGAALYQLNCASCHGPLVNSTKSGRTLEQIRAAMLNVSEMQHINLNEDQLQKIALALVGGNQPFDGTISVRTLGSVAEGNLPATSVTAQFELEFIGTSQTPFTVGYVTSNGTALAGSDYLFRSGTIQFQGTNGEKHIVSVPVLSDPFEESDETLFLDIGAASSNRIRFGNSSATGVISNDDSLASLLPPQSDAVKLAYAFNGNYLDSLGLSNGSPQGDTVISTTSRVGSGSLDLDTGADHLVVPGNNLSALNEMTIGMWVYWRNSAATLVRIADFGSSTQNYIFFSPRDGNNRCRAEVRIANVPFFVQCPTTTTIPANQWIHVAVSISSSTDQMKIFLNGTEVASMSTFTGNLSALTYTTNYIGRSRAGNPEYDGLVDEFLVWGRALTATEIVQLIGMTQSPQINSGVELRYESQLISNGAVINLGDVPVGQERNLSLLINNLGPARLSFTNSPNISVTGAHAARFTPRLEPLTWHQSINPGNGTAITISHLPTAPGASSATVVIANNNLRDGNLSFGITARAVGTPLPTPIPSGNTELDQGAALYGMNCASCHGALATSTKRLATEPAIAGAITSVPQMQGLTLNRAQRQLISLALNTPVAPPDGKPYVRNARAVVGTATLVASKLSNIFLPYNRASFIGADLSIEAIIRSNVLGVNSAGMSTGEDRAKFFGGSCQSLFDVGCSDQLRLPNMMPSSNAIRSGNVVRTCDLITGGPDGNRAIDTVLSKIGRTVSSPLDENAARDLLQLFTPGRAIPAYQVGPLAQFTKQAPMPSGQTEVWRWTITMLCESMIWEQK